MRKFIGLILSIAFVIAVTSCASGVEEANSNTDDITDEVIETEEVNELLYEYEDIEFRYCGTKEDIGPKFSLVNNSDKNIRAFIEYESIDNVMCRGGGYYLDAEAGETSTMTFRYISSKDLEEIGLDDYNKLSFTVRYRDVTDDNNPFDIAISDYITLSYSDKTDFELTSNGTEIFNSDGIEIYYIGCDGQYGDDVSYKYTNFDVINRSDKTICIETDKFVYSGIEVPCIDTVFVAPGCKSYYQISTYKSNEEDAGVKDTSKAETIFLIRDWFSNSKDEICKSDLIEINRE